MFLELNVSARDEDLHDVEENLREAIELHFEDVEANPGAVVSPMPTGDFIEFLRDMEPDWYKDSRRK